MRVGIVTQARMTSTRLPGKVLLPVLGRPLLAYHLERLARVRGADCVIVATTVNGTDQPVVDLVEAMGFGVFRGSEADVLARYHGAAREFDLDAVVRVTSDCPLIDPAVVDSVIDAYVGNPPGFDYVSNCLVRTFPRGMDTEVISMVALIAAHREATEDSHREHVTPYILANAGRFRAMNVAYGRNESAHRWTVDTPDDFALIRNILETLYPNNPGFGLGDVLGLMRLHPDWVGINAHIVQKRVD